MKKTDSVSFYITIIFSIAIAQFACKIVYTFFPDAPSQVGARITEIIMIFAALFLRNTVYIQPGLGLKVPSADKKKTVLHVIILSTVSLAILFLARIIGQQFIPGMAQRPYFGLYLNYFRRLSYPVVVIAQEILAKAILQHGIEKTLSEDKWLIAVMVTGAIFGMVHIHISAAMMLGSFALAVASGIYYHYQKNIWACMAVHFIFGFFPRCFGLIV